MGACLRTHNKNNDFSDFQATFSLLPASFQAQHHLRNVTHGPREPGQETVGSQGGADGKSVLPFKDTHEVFDILSHLLRLLPKSRIIHK